MKRCLVVALSLMLLLGFGAASHAATLKVGLDADPVSLDPQVQLSGGMLQLSHWVFDPLVRWTQEMTFEPVWPRAGSGSTN
jgi:peptide/nickel transport system substrate-binding protein